MSELKDSISEALEALDAPSLQLKLSSELDAAHLAIERLDKVILVAVTVLYDQDTDLDSSVATVLENAVQAELIPAGERIRDALKLLQEVTSHG